MGRKAKIASVATGVTAAAAYAGLKIFGGGAEAPRIPADPAPVIVNDESRPHVGPMPSVVGGEQMAAVNDINSVIVAAARCMVSNQVFAGGMVESRGGYTNRKAADSPEGKAAHMPTLTVQTDKTTKTYRIGLKSADGQHYVEARATGNANDPAFAAPLYPSATEILRGAQEAAGSSSLTSLTEGPAGSTLVERGTGGTVKMTVNDQEVPATTENLNKWENGALSDMAQVAQADGLYTCLPDMANAAGALPDGVTFPSLPPVPPSGGPSTPAAMPSSSTRY